jgi:hypothetical protein
MTNTKTTKLTKRDHFNTLLSITEVAENPVLVAFIEHELELLDKKNAADRKPTAVQVANDGLREAILDFMKEGKGYTVSDLIKQVPACADLSQSKVSAILRPLLLVTAKGEANPDGVLERYEEKGKAYFKLA